MVWSSQMESATPSPFTKAFWRLFHGRVVSHWDARALWKHRRIMFKMVLLGGLLACLFGNHYRLPPAEMGGWVACSSHTLKWAATSSRRIAFKSLRVLPSGPGAPSDIPLIALVTFSTVTEATRDHSTGPLGGSLLSSCLDTCWNTPRQHGSCKAIGTREGSTSQVPERRLQCKHSASLMF